MLSLSLSLFFFLLLLLLPLIDKETFSRAFTVEASSRTNLDEEREGGRERERAEKEGRILAP